MEDKEKFKLYVKCSCINQRSLGACTLSHRLMMLLVAKEVESEVITKNTDTQEIINITYPGRKIPFLVHHDTVNDDVFAIEDYLEQYGKKLASANPTAKEFVARNKIFMKFSYMVKNNDPVTHPSLENHLNTELKKLDDHLAKQGTKFVGGPELTLLDCTLLPQLLHLRVAAKAICDYDIPESFKYVKEYVNAGDHEVAFSETRPTDDEITAFWKGKIEK